MATSKPKSLTIRSYQVGFGDCFLLTFHYNSKNKNSDRHVLIDFGSTGQPKATGENLMLRVAQDIKQQCNGKLHAVIATHRHKDHISGFATNKKGTASGDIIASCEPDVVLQPWTEHPDARVDATQAPNTMTTKK
jgi:glyoxylase-like metal-dependent hydrolase (beta-lactamase superfamily II)